MNNIDDRDRARRRPYRQRKSTKQVPPVDDDFLDFPTFRVPYIYIEIRETQRTEIYPDFYCAAL